MKKILFMMAMIALLLPTQAFAVPFVETPKVAISASCAVDNTSRADHPRRYDLTVKNLSVKHKELMMQTASKWSGFIIHVPSDYGRKTLSKSEEARLIFEWLTGYTSMDYETLMEYKLIGNDWIMIDDMKISEMEKHVRDYDPYSLICYASREWMKEQRAVLTPLEFAQLYALLLESRGIHANVVVGQSNNVFDHNLHQPDESGYCPPFIVKKADFRVEFTVDGVKHLSNVRQAMTTGNAGPYFSVKDTKDDWGWSRSYIFPKLY